MRKKILSVVLVIIILITGIAQNNLIKTRADVVTNETREYVMSTDIEESEVSLDSIPIIDRNSYKGNLGDSAIFYLDGYNRNGNVGIDGTKYSNGFEAWIARWNFKEEISWAYATFDLGGKYKRLIGNTNLIPSYNMNNFNTSIYFYDGDTLLASYTLTNTDYIKEINVDVSGVENLKLLVQDNVGVKGGTSIALYDMFLYDSDDPCSLHYIAGESFFKEKDCYDDGNVKLSIEEQLLLYKDRSRVNGGLSINDSLEFSCIVSNMGDKVSPETDVTYRFFSKENKLIHSFTLHVPELQPGRLQYIKTEEKFNDTFSSQFRIDNLKRFYDYDLQPCNPITNQLEKSLDSILENKIIGGGTIKGPSWEFGMKGKTYTFTPLDFDFDAGLPLSNLKYQAIIDTENKTVKVLLGVSKTGKSEIKQTSKMNDSTWGQQYQSIKKMYKDLTGFDAKTTRNTWNNFENMKSDLNNLKCDMIVSADMRITGYAEYTYNDNELFFKEGGIIEKVSVGASIPTPIIGSFVYLSLGLEVSEEGTIKVKMNENVPELILSLTLGATASAKITGEIPVVAKVEGIIDATLSATFQNVDPKFTIDMKGDITFKATALKGIIEIFEHSWNYLNCQIFPEFIDKNKIQETYSSMDQLLLNGVPTDRIVGSSYSTKGIHFVEENCYEQNNAQIIPLDNNRKLLLWLDDIEEKSSKNRTSLMYSVYDGTNWTVPKAVYDDGCFNGGFSYYILENQNVCVVYQKGNYVFDDDTDYTEIMRSVDPYLTVFDGTEFSIPVQIRNTNDSYEDNFQFRYLNDKLEILFEEYTSDYLAGNSDNMNIISSNKVGESWQESMIYSTEEFIADYQYVGEQLYVEIYNSDSEHYELYNTNRGIAGLINTLSQEVDLQSDASYLYYVDNNLFTAMNVNESKELELPFGTDYKIISNGRATKLVYEYINNDYSTTIFCADVIDGDVSEVSLYGTVENYVKTYAGCLDEMNELYLIMTACNVNSNLSTEDYLLQLMRKEEITSLNSTYLYYDEGEVEAGKDLKLVYDVNNNGNTDVRKYNVSLYDDAGNILVESLVDEDISVGESKTQELVYTVPTDFTEQNVYLQLESTDKGTVYSKQEAIIKHNDIEISDIEVIQNCNHNYEIKCTVENAGYQKAERISLSLNNYRNQLVENCEISELASGSSASQTIILTKEQYDSLSMNNTYIEVSSSLSEYNYENNTMNVDFVSVTEDNTHRYTNYQSNHDATCTTDGTKSAVCDNGCGKKDTVIDRGSAIGHSWSDWEIKKDPTAFSKGIKERNCICCEEIETETIVKLAGPVISSKISDDTGIEIKWDKVKDADGYYLYRSINGKEYVKIKKITSTEIVSYVDTGAMKNGTKYQYKLRAYQIIDGLEQYSEYSNETKSILINKNETETTMDNEDESTTANQNETTVAEEEEISTSEDILDETTSQRENEDTSEEITSQREDEGTSEEITSQREEGETESRNEEETATVEEESVYDTTVQDEDVTDNENENTTVAQELENEIDSQTDERLLTQVIKEDETGKFPQTGDGTPLWWICIFMIAGVAGSCLVYRSNRRENK